jgi:hypothetical protein
MSTGLRTFPGFADVQGGANVNPKPSFPRGKKVDRLVNRNRGRANASGGASRTRNLQHAEPLAAGHHRQAKLIVPRCHAERPHLATNNLPLMLGRPPDPVGCLGPKDVVARERLGGLSRHYVRRAA